MYRIIKLSIFSLIGVFALFSCEKNMGPPSLSFIEGGDFLTHDTVLMVGDTVTVGVLIEWNGLNKIKSLEVEVGGQLLNTYSLDLDRGEFSFKLMKSASPEEVWKFTIFDSKGNKDSKSITFTKDPNSIYGAVVSYETLRLGAQNNELVPGFFSFSDATSYNLESAFNNQSQIDLVYYFEAPDSSVLGSPGANIANTLFTGSFAFDNWTSKNTTLFVKTDLKTTDFDNLFHDGLIIRQYQETSAKRKAKNLKVGDVYVFKTQTGLFGAFLVKALEGSHDGSIEVGLKIQELP